MILRRLTESLKEQSWTAIWIEFVLLVVGVFLGIQVSNWNAARAFDALERDHLRNLRAEIEQDIESTTARRLYYTGVNAAGERALAFLEEDQPCTDQCWRLLVDFFHASQWVDVGVAQTTFTEMRRIGLPRTRTLAIAIESYYSTNVAINTISNERPAYRTLVRGLIPVRAQQAIWTSCHAAHGAIETFNNDCPASIPMEQAARAVAGIGANPEIVPTLTQWTAVGSPIVKYLGTQNDDALKAIAAIDKELGTDP